MLVTYHQLFGYNWWGTLWRCAATALSAMLMMIPLMFAVLYFFETSLESYLWVLAVAVVSIAVILVVSYRISLYKSKKI